MALTRVWSGNVDGDVSDPLNWRPVSVRSAKYRWTVTGTAGEYYLELAGGGNPALADPYDLKLNGVTIAQGTLGALTANTWQWGASGAGFDTIIYRTSATADPDTLAIDSLQAYLVPQAGDSVVVPASAGLIDQGLDLSGTALVDWIVEDGYGEDVASATAYLHLSLSGRLSWSSTRGTAYVSVGASAISAEVLSTGAGSAAGGRGLYLLGSALATLDVHGGKVALAALPGETSTVTTIRVSGSRASLWVGPGVTLTTYYQQDGTDCRLRCGCTTCIVWSGVLTTDDAGAITTLTVHGGAVVANATGTIGTLNLEGGTLTFLDSALPRTVTTLNLDGGSLLVDKTIVTITTLVVPTGPLTLTVTA